MAIDLNCEMSNFYSAMAYPGSELFNMAIQNRWKLPENWLGFSQHAFETLPLPTKNIGAGEVLAFRDWVWNKYFTNSKFLNMIHSKFGDKTFNHIRELTNTKLDRKYSASIDFDSYNVPQKIQNEIII